MSAVAVIVTADTAAVATLVAQLKERLDTPSLMSFMETRAHPILANRVSARFAGEGDDATGPWPQLAVVTSRIRAMQGYGPYHPINIRSGELRRWVTESHLVRTNARGVVLQMPGPGGGKVFQKFRQAQQGGYAPGGVTGRGAGAGSFRVPPNRRRGGLQWPRLGGAYAVGGGHRRATGLSTDMAGPNRPAPPRPVLALSQIDENVIGRALLDWIRIGLQP